MNYPEKTNRKNAVKSFINTDNEMQTAITRADLMQHPAFERTFSDTAGNPRVWQLDYRCPEWGHDLEAAWSAPRNAECPVCGAEVKPRRVTWLPDCQQVKGDPAFDLWESLPEATGQPD